MALRTRISLALTLWLVCEVMAFTAVVALIGLGGAIVLGIATSVIGASLLKKAGMSALSRLRQGVGPGGLGVLQGTIALDDTLAAIGALLLLLPGFASDAIGLLLAVPFLRRWIAGVVRSGGLRSAHRGTGGRPGPPAIDLDPEDWRPIDETSSRTMSKP